MNSPRGPTFAIAIGIVLFAVVVSTRANPATVSPPVPATSAAGPQELMTDLSTRLLASLDQDRGRIRRQPELVLRLVDELLSPHFDAEYTARLVLGAHWRDATAEQRRRFASALYRTLLWTYAGAVADWSPDRLRILPHRDDPAALQVLVRTEVARPGASVVKVDYRLHSTTDGWKVFDVVVDGVSYVRTYHDDIDGEVGRNGLDASIVRLETGKTGARTP